MKVFSVLRQEKEESHVRRKGSLCTFRRHLKESRRLYFPFCGNELCSEVKVPIFFSTYFYRALQHTSITL